MGDYHVYLQLDVLLLAEFFEKFRRTCLDYYKLDSLHYYTISGLAWDAALRISRVDLELITNANIYNMIEKRIRGGISVISPRHAKANNPTLTSSYDSKLPRQDLIYKDTYNLCAHAMSQYLPTGDCRVLNDEEVQDLGLETLDDKGIDGYIYEVDLHNPASLHDYHDDYPLAPESIVVDRSMYSPTQQAVFPKSVPQRKLTKLDGQIAVCSPLQEVKAVR